MNTTATASKQAIEAKLSAIAGHAVEVTVRGDRAFTFSFDALDPYAAQRLADTVPGEIVNIVADAECGTFIYVN